MITYIIIAITAFISITSMENHALKSRMMFNPYAIRHHREWWRFFTNGIIHADWMHLIFNMLSLYMIGIYVEAEYSSDEVYGEKGKLFYVLLYVGGLVMSSLYSYEKHKNDSWYNALGASGAVSAVIFAFIVLQPTARLGLMFIPIPIPAYVFGLIYLGVEYYMGKRGQSNIGHDAHFWGAVFGVVFTILLKPSLFHDFISKITGH